MSKNKWIQFIKEFAEQNNMIYKDALKNEKAKSQYRKHLNSLLIFGRPIIEVPKTIDYIDKRGKEHEINTLTKAGNFTRREKKPAINLIANNLNKINISKSLSKYSLSKKIKEGVANFKFKSNLKSTNEKLKSNVKKLKQTKITKPSYEYESIYVGRKK